MELFEERYASVAGADPVQLLHRFRHLPYENLSKIIACQGRETPAPRLPRQVMQGHLRLGTGGTCFSLTELFRHLALAAGLDSYPVMAHMRHGPDIHCALRVEHRGRAYLLDPGYLVQRPLPLGQTVSLDTWHPGEALLVPAGRLKGACTDADGDFDLYTLEGDGPRWRYRFTDAPPTPEAFLHHWHRSFQQPGMRSLLVTHRGDGGERIYLHNHRLRISGQGGKVNQNVRQTLHHTVEEIFGIDGQVTSAARDLLERRRQEGVRGR